jgi:uncharacterized protein (DUF305 family)
MTSRRLARLAAIFLAALALPVVVSACGSDDDEASEGSPTEQAFLEGMIPHHESAVEMAKVAQERARHRELGLLANEIISAQNGEIRQMEAIHERLYGSEITPDPEAHERLGLSAKEAGMDHMESAMELETARAFDREFIDMMVAHHQGAIRMANRILKDTDDPELRKLAQGIVRAQRREIEEMNAWRTEWYGEPSPAGLAPDSEGTETVEGGEHEGH